MTSYHVDIYSANLAGSASDMTTLIAAMNSVKRHFDAGLVVNGGMVRGVQKAALQSRRRPQLPLFHGKGTSYSRNYRGRGVQLDEEKGHGPSHAERVSTRGSLARDRALVSVGIERNLAPESFALGMYWARQQARTSKKPAITGQAGYTHTDS